MDFCINCGKENKSQSDFCSECEISKLENSCIDCGHHLGEGVLFCTQCGKNQALPKKDMVERKEQIEGQNDDLLESEKINPFQKSPVNIRPKKPLTLKTKIVLSTMLALLVVGLGLNYIIQQQLDPKKQVIKMNEAFNAEDAELFYSYFEFPENTNGTASQFYDWVAQSGWSGIKEELLEQLERDEQGFGADPIDIMYADALRITKKDLMLGLYKKTLFIIKPLDVSITMPFAGTDITMKNTNITNIVTTDGMLPIGKFIPGTYTYKYNYDGPYMPITGQNEVAIYSYNVPQFEEVLEMDYEYVDLYSNYEDAIIYINDKSINKTVAEIETLQPVSFNGDNKIHLVAKNSEGKDIISSSHALDKNVIEFEYEEDKRLALAENVKIFYQMFRNDYIKAIDYIDFSYVLPYFPENAQITNDYKKFVEDHQSIPGYRYNFISNEVGDVQVISNSEIELYSTEVFDYFSDDDGGLSYVREKRYKIHYEEGKFTITEIKDLNTQKKEI